MAENTEASEVQDDAGSDAEMSGSGSESEQSLPLDEEAVEDPEIPQGTPETGSEETLKNNIRLTENFQYSWNRLLAEVSRLWDKC